MRNEYVAVTKNWTRLKQNYCVSLMRANQHKQKPTQNSCDKTGVDQCNYRRLAAGVTTISQNELQ